MTFNAMDSPLSVSSKIHPKLRTSRFLKTDGSLMNSEALLSNFTIQRFFGGNLDFDV